MSPPTVASQYYTPSLSFREALPPCEIPDCQGDSYGYQGLLPTVASRELWGKLFYNLWINYQLRAWYVHRWRVSYDLLTPGQMYSADVIVCGLSSVWSSALPAIMSCLDSCNLQKNVSYRVYLCRPCGGQNAVVRWKCVFSGKTWEHALAFFAYLYERELHFEQRRLES